MIYITQLMGHLRAVCVSLRRRGDGEAGKWGTDKMRGIVETRAVRRENRGRFPLERRMKGWLRMTATVGG